MAKVTEMDRIRLVQRAWIHPGAAHLDETVALGLVLQVNPGLQVTRGNPSDEDLANPNVLVMDCSGRYEPELLNFDHHQMNPADRECAASLVARFLGVREALENRPWFHTLRVMDCQGPFVWGKERGLVAPLKALEGTNPIGQALTGMLAKVPQGKEIPPDLLNMIRLLVGELVQEAVDFTAEIKAVKWELSPLGNQEILVVPQVAKGTVTGAIRDKLVAEGHPVYLLISLSDREGEGWMAYRYDDHPSWNLHLLEGKDGVIFTHKGGFIAKFSPKVSQGEVMAYLKGILAQ